MKILFALADKFHATHNVRGIAGKLVQLGHDVRVIEPNQAPPNDATEGFSDRLPPDVVHFWGPPTNACAFPFLEKRGSSPLVVHLDAPSGSVLLDQAVGVTAVTERLDSLVSPELPRLLLWPGLDSQLFYPRSKDPELLSQLRLPVNSTILCYAGNVHAANARAVRSLYLAVAILNREGIPATLVRAGRDSCPFLGADEQWARKYSVELGYMPHNEIPRVLSLADILIQPGADNSPNKFWVPAQLPEVFAMGRPVILPRANVGRYVEHGVHAWVQPKVDALRIIEAVQRLRSDQALVKRLSEGALHFYKQHFDWETNAARLEVFYQMLLEGLRQPNAATADRNSRAVAAESLRGRPNLLTPAEARLDLRPAE